MTWLATNGSDDITTEIATRIFAGRPTENMLSCGAARATSASAESTTISATSAGAATSSPSTKVCAKPSSAIWPSESYDGVAVSGTTLNVPASPSIMIWSPPVTTSTTATNSE